MDAIPTLLGALALLAWLVLLFLRGGFWLIRERLDEEVGERSTWPSVVAIVPARNEASVISGSIRSVVAQDYPALAVILVDDGSRDGTAEIARRAAKTEGRAEQLTAIRATAPRPGWTGKLWALSEGLLHAKSVAPDAVFVWFTDGDIEHDPKSLKRLVNKAEREDRDLVSLMVLLRCESLWERLLIPPFVFFFAMLYPFAWSNDPHKSTAAAAGGCVLLRRAALERAGGLEPIRGRIIDDCALAELIKKRGREGGSSIWLGLTNRVRSTRAYGSLAEIWSMVSRSAYAQLGYSPLLLACTFLGMTLVYIVPVALILAYPWHANSVAAALGALVWGLMGAAMMPVLRLYHQPRLTGLLLPGVALFYCAMTWSSAMRHWRGGGGQWKGRIQAHRGSVDPRA